MRVRFYDYTGLRGGTLHGVRNSGHGVLTTADWRSWERVEIGGSVIYRPPALQKTLNQHAELRSLNQMHRDHYTK